MPSVKIKKLYESSWTILIDLGRDPITGKRVRKKRSVKGTKRDAEKVARQIERDIEDRKFTVESKRITIKELIEEFLEHIKTHEEPGTYNYYKTQSHRVIEHLGGIKIDQLHKAHVQRFINHLATQEPRRDGKPGTLDPGTIQHHYRCIRAAVNYAQDMGYIGYDPIGRVKLPNKQHKEQVVLTREQLDRLLDAVKDTRWYPLFYLTAHTGMREGEICGLRWEDIDWERQAIRVRVNLKRGKPPILGDVKNHEQRTIHLRPEDIEVLKIHQSQQNVAKAMATAWAHPEHVFVTPEGKRIDPTVPSGMLAKITKKIKDMPTIRMHALRHTHGSMLLQAGWDIAAVSKRLGHKTVEFTARVYSHMLPDIQQQYIRSGKY